MRFSTRLLVAGATFLLFGSSVGVQISRAQCTISGPTQVCPGDSIELCAPAMTNVSYLWQVPDGTLYMTECIFAFEPGLYTLSIRDQVTRTWMSPCSLDVRSGRASAPDVTGPASTCSAVPVEWCGPSGSFEYAWNGPNGFTANTACVSIADAGDYLLKVRSLPAGCWGDSTVRSLVVESCRPGATNCPRPAWWWALNCSGRHRGHGRLDRSQIETVARCVDESSELLNWEDDAAGFIRTVVQERRTLRMRARRQFATVWANVCAARLGVTPPGGSSLGLDLATPLDARLGGGTIGSWLALAEAELTRLESTQANSRSLKESLRGLIRTGWHINHGRYIGTTCRSESDHDDDLTAAAEAGMVLTEGEPEPLEAELVDDAEVEVSLGAIEPNPFSGQTSLAFSVSGSAAAPVSIAVYDVSGRVVRELANGSYGPGQHVVRWDGSTADGTRAKSGIYFIRGSIGAEPVGSRVCLVR